MNIVTAWDSLAERNLILGNRRQHLGSHLPITVFCGISELTAYYRDSPFSRKAAIWTGRHAKTYSPQIPHKISIKPISILSSHLRLEIFFLYENFCVSLCISLHATFQTHLLAISGTCLCDRQFFFHYSLDLNRCQQDPHWDRSGLPVYFVINSICGNPV